VVVARQFHFDPETYLDAVRAEVPAYDELQAVVANATSGRSVQAVLDLGTGTGETLRRVAQLQPTARLVGIDESSQMLALARRQLPNADLRTTRLQDPLPDGPFDLVVSAFTVHHLTPTEKADLFARVASQLALRGRFVLGDVVIPDNPADALTPIDPPYDSPSRIEDQMLWLANASLRPEIVWRHHDLVVMIADR
jgi:tRNA (cmo5U34)-methyltransferase